MHTSQNQLPSRRSNQGISLIVVLFMLVIIGITAGTAMRTATSEQRATNNLRVQNTAQQYAEAALRYCEAQMNKADGARATGFNSADIPTIPTIYTSASPGWVVTTNWTATGTVAGRFDLPTTVFSDGDTNAPTFAPQCFVEKQTVSGQGATTFVQTVITARGFSPDYARDANGKTIQGSVVWLQSIINAI